MKKFNSLLWIGAIAVGSTLFTLSLVIFGIPERPKKIPIHTDTILIREKETVYVHDTVRIEYTHPKKKVTLPDSVVEDRSKTDTTNI